MQGGIIAIRGISGADNNPLNDQAVSFNIDGVSIGRASVRRMSDMDIEQIEVLKGPQALYFGKNSPDGIIPVRTADPTPSLEAKISQAYEFMPGNGGQKPIFPGRSATVWASGSPAFFRI